MLYCSLLYRIEKIRRYNPRSKSSSIVANKKSHLVRCMQLVPFFRQSPFRRIVQKHQAQIHVETSFMLPKRRFWRTEQSVAWSLLKHFHGREYSIRETPRRKFVQKRTRNSLFNLPKSSFGEHERSGVHFRGTLRRFVFYIEYSRLSKVPRKCTPGIIAFQIIIKCSIWALCTLQ